LPNLLLGDQGDLWHKGELNLPANFTHIQPIFIIAERGSGTSSDIAIDDLILTKAPCNGELFSHSKA